MIALVKFNDLGGRLLAFVALHLVFLLACIRNHFDLGYYELPAGGTVVVLRSISWCGTGSGSRGARNCVAIGPVDGYGMTYMRREVC